MNGSKSINDRKYLLKHCYKIIFNSDWSKKRFLEGMHNKFVNSDKLLIIFQSAQKNKIDLSKKNNLISYELMTKISSRGMIYLARLQ